MLRVGVLGTALGMGGLTCRIGAGCRRRQDHEKKATRAIFIEKLVGGPSHNGYSSTSNRSTRRRFAWFVRPIDTNSRRSISETSGGSRRLLTKFCDCSVCALHARRHQNSGREITSTPGSRRIPHCSSPVSVGRLGERAGK